MADYIPGDEATKILWLENFATWINANGTAHGLTPPEVLAFCATAAAAPMTVAANETAQAAARAATVTKNTAINTAIEQARDIAQRLQTTPSMTDTDRAAAGLTISDTTPTPAPPDQVMTIPPPLILLDFSVRRQITVHWGPNPSNERENGRPTGTIGCQVQAARGGIPAEETLWIPLEIDTESPIIHTVDETTPTTYAYRARYVGKNLKLGPFGDPAVCTVSV